LPTVDKVTGNPSIRSIIIIPPSPTHHPSSLTPTPPPLPLPGGLVQEAIIVCTYCVVYLLSVYFNSAAYCNDIAVGISWPFVWYNFPLNHFMKEILEYLSENYWQLSETAMNYIVRKTDEMDVKKKDILLKQGEICRYVWFVKKGLLRSYGVSETGKYFSNWFMKENDVATSVISFFREEKTEEVIEVAEDSHLCRMSRKDLFIGLAKYRSLAMLTLMIIIKYYCQSRLLESSLRRKEPEQIHQYLLQQHIELVQRVPEKHLASFLGVSEPTYNGIKTGKKTKTDAKIKKKKEK